MCYQVTYRILTGKTLQLPEDESSLTEITDTEINALLQVDIGTSAQPEKIVKVRLLCSFRQRKYN